MRRRLTVTDAPTVQRILDEALNGSMEWRNKTATQIVEDMAAACDAITIAHEMCDGHQFEPVGYRGKNGRWHRMRGIEMCVKCGVQVELGEKLIQERRTQRVDK